MIRTPGQGWLVRDDLSVFKPVSSESMLKRVSDLVADIGIATVVEEGARGMTKATSVLSKKKASDVLALLAGMLEEPDRVFDANPHKLNTPSGVVSLKTGKVRPPRREDRFLKVTGCDYDPDAVSDRWEQAWEAVDPDAQGWFRLRLGQALTGARPNDDRVLFLKGGGANGKSVLMDAVSMAAGLYATAVPPRVLLGSPSDHSTEMMTLQNVRLAFLEEMPEHHMQGAQLKRLVGPREITARRVHQDNVTFPVEFSLFVTTNYALRMADTDEGTWRRVTVVPFPFHYVNEPAAPDERKRDPELKRWSETVADPGVLAWLVRAARDAWRLRESQFLQLPESVEAATNATRSENDLLSLFAEERLLLDQQATTSKAEVFKAYLNWCAEQNQKPSSRVVFLQRFRETEVGRHVRDGRSATARFWVGVKVRERSIYLPEVPE